MPGDKYSAVWVSHSSISAFLACPRAYYLKNVYRDPKTNHKIQLINPPLALGQAVHEVIESLSVLPVDRRFEEPLAKKLDQAWQKVGGKKGGFPNPDTEAKYKKRGEEMLERVRKNPGPLKKLAVKIEMNLPWFWLSEKDNIILCGKIDWLEYLSETDSVHIIDFKTSKGEEREGSMQLPIYHLLVHNCQKHKVAKASYWYVDRDDEPKERPLPDLDESHETILKIAKKIKLARQLGSFKCPQGDGCRACKPFEAILEGKATFVRVDEIDRDVYVLKETDTEGEQKSMIL